MLRRCLERLPNIHNATITSRLSHQSRFASNTPKPRPNAPGPIKAGSPPTLAHSLLHPLLTRSPVSRALKYALAFLLTTHIFFEYFYVLEGAWGISMLPTIASHGDSLLISKYYRRGRQLSVGDVVSFKHPVFVGEYAVKRILGMPGDFVMVDTPGKGGGRMVQVRSPVLHG